VHSQCAVHTVVGTLRQRTLHLGRVPRIRNSSSSSGTINRDSGSQGIAGLTIESLTNMSRKCIEELDKVGNRVV
jgi:hypothetical protein